MAALTYGFSQLGPHPLEEAFATERDAVVTEAPRPGPAESIPPPSQPLAAAAPALAQSASATSREPELAPVDAAPALSAPARGAQDEPAPPPQAPPSNELAWGLPSDPDSARRELPEFTDGSKPRARERAADGPRIDSLFERAEQSPSAPGPATASSPPPTTDARPAVALTSCEAAIAKNSEQLDIGGPRGPADITREVYASILQNGQYLAGCSLPERTVFEICAAVKNGHAVGVTVVSSPSNGELNACVRRAVSRLSFPASERLDVTHTRFDAVKR